MKCRRRNFNKHLHPSTEFYWDRARQAVIATTARANSSGGERAMRRHAAENIVRARRRRRRIDNMADRLITMDCDYEGQAERVGDKFRILDEQEA